MTVRRAGGDIGHPYNGRVAMYRRNLAAEARMWYNRSASQETAMPRPRCKCGQPITNPLARRCAVCRMLTNFHDANCAVFAHYKNDCSCGADAVMTKVLEQMEKQKGDRPNDRQRT